MLVNAMLTSEELFERNESACNIVDILLYAECSLLI